MSICIFTNHWTIKEKELGIKDNLFVYKKRVEIVSGKREIKRSSLLLWLLYAALEMKSGANLIRMRILDSSDYSTLKLSISQVMT